MISGIAGDLHLLEKLNQNKCPKCDSKPNLYSSMIQRCNVTVDLGKEELFELGRKSPYYRHFDFPQEVVDEITIDNIRREASEDGFRL